MTKLRALRLARKWAQGHVCSLRDGEAEAYHAMFAAMLEESMPNEPLTLEQLREIVEPTPVWWDWVCGWVLARKGMIVSWGGRYHNVEELRGSFYRRPPEGEEDT